jgi:hypothetical protein
MLGVVALWWWLHGFSGGQIRVFLVTYLCYVPWFEDFFLQKMPKSDIIFDMEAVIQLLEY